MMVAARKGAVHGLLLAVGFWAGVLFISNLDKLIPQKGLR